MKRSRGHHADLLCGLHGGVRRATGGHIQQAVLVGMRAARCARHGCSLQLIEQRNGRLGGAGVAGVHRSNDQAAAVGPTT